MLFIALRDWGTNGYLYVHVPSETSAPVKKTLVLGTSGGLRHPGRERADDHAQDALPKLYPRRPRERSRNRSPSRAPSRRRSLFQRVDCKSCQSCPLRPPPFAHLRRFAWQTRHALLARGSPAPLECRRYPGRSLRAEKTQAGPYRKRTAHGPWREEELVDRGAPA